MELPSFQFIHIRCQQLCLFENASNPSAKQEGGKKAFADASLKVRKRSMKFETAAAVTKVELYHT